VKRALVLLVVAPLACVPVACKGLSSGQQPIDIYVPEPDGGGNDASPEASPELGQVDRDGHPLATVLFVPGSLQDEYNAQSSYEAIFPRLLQDALESRLVWFDTIALGDGGPDPVDWPVPDGGTHPLLPIFVTDVLLVDTGQSCTSADGGFAQSYLDIEKEIYLNGSPHTTCGGRTPNEDVVDETLTLVVTNGRVPVTQGVPGPTQPSTTSFPYFAAPN
jgi:hypothetical protein